MIDFWNDLSPSWKIIVFIWAAIVLFDGLFGGGSGGAAR